MEMVIKRICFTSILMLLMVSSYAQIKVKGPYGISCKTVNPEYNNPFDAYRLLVKINPLDLHGRMVGSYPSLDLAAQYNTKRFHFSVSGFHSYPTFITRILSQLPNKARGYEFNGRMLFDSRLKPIKYRSLYSSYTSSVMGTIERHITYDAMGQNTIALRFGYLETRWDNYLNYYENGAHYEGYPVDYPEYDYFKISGLADFHMRTVYLGLSWFRAFDVKFAYNGKKIQENFHKEFYVDFMYAPYQHIYNSEMETKVVITPNNTIFLDEHSVGSNEYTEKFEYYLNDTKKSPYGIRGGIGFTGTDELNLNLTAFEVGYFPGLFDYKSNVTILFKWSIILGYKSNR